MEIIRVLRALVYGGLLFFLTIPVVLILLVKSGWWAFFIGCAVCGFLVHRATRLVLTAR
jgi:hypothetical protein